MRVHLPQQKAAHASGVAVWNSSQVATITTARITLHSDDLATTSAIYYVIDWKGVRLSLTTTCVAITFLYNRESDYTCLIKIAFN